MVLKWFGNDLEMIWEQYLAVWSSEQLIMICYDNKKHKRAVWKDDRPSTKVKMVPSFDEWFCITKCIYLTPRSWFELLLSLQRSFTLWSSPFANLVLFPPPTFRQPDSWCDQRLLVALWIIDPAMPSTVGRILFAPIQPHLHTMQCIAMNKVHWIFLNIVFLSNQTFQMVFQSSCSSDVHNLDSEIAPKTQPNLATDVTELL